MEQWRYSTFEKAKSPKILLIKQELWELTASHAQNLTEKTDILSLPKSNFKNDRS
jgi:hypothetical protein